MRRFAPANRRPRPVAIVLGAGVNGLTTALKLAMDGFQVHVIAKEPPYDTTSVGAGAIWEYPPFAVYPEELACRLVLASRPFFDQLKKARTGVVERRSAYAWRDPPADTSAPAWTPLVKSFRATMEPEYCGETKAGYSHLVPVIYMRKYLLWLVNNCSTLQVRFHIGHSVSTVSSLLASLPQLGIQLAFGQQTPLLVNCLGLGSARVFGDDTMFSVKGQLAYVYAPHVRSVLDDTDHPNGLTYVIPQDDGILACAGWTEKNNWNPFPEPDIEEGILRRCRTSFPSLKYCPVVGRWAGLRPGREAGLRLELAQKQEQGVHVLHNYGHGGSGVVLSWGCALKVSELAAWWATNFTLQPRKAPHDLGDADALCAHAATFLTTPLVPKGGHVNVTDALSTPKRAINFLGNAVD